MTGCTVANLFPNALPGFNINIVNDYAPACYQGSAEAQVQCGTAPFIYSWEISYNGFGWQPAGNTEIINFNVECLDAGILMLRLTVTDGAGQSRTFTKWYPISHHGTYRTTSSNNANTQKEPIVQKIHPNPFNTSTQLDIYMEETDRVTVFITDATGGFKKEVFQSVVPKGKRSIKISGAALKTGIYYLQVATPKKMESHQLLITK